MMLSHHAFVILICFLSGSLALPKYTVTISSQEPQKYGILPEMVDPALEVVRSHLLTHWSSSDIPRILLKSNLCPVDSQDQSSKIQNNCLKKWSKDWTIYLDTNVVSPLVADFRPHLVSEISSVYSGLSKRSPREHSVEATYDLAISRGQGLRMKLRGLLQSLARKWRGADTKARIDDKIV